MSALALSSGNKPFSLSTFFGISPDLEKEDADIYEDLLKKITDAVKPRDLLEEMWVRDIVDLSWDIIDKRRVKQNLPKTVMIDALIEILGPVVDGPKISNIQRGAKVGRDFYLESRMRSERLKQFSSKPASQWPCGCACVCKRNRNYLAH